MSVIDKIQVSGVTYDIGGGSVDTAITSGSTNAVAGGAVYDKVTITSGGEEFISSAQSTSQYDYSLKVFPSGTTKFTLTSFPNDEITMGGSSIDIYDSTDTKVSSFGRVSDVDSTYATVDGAVGDALITFTANDGYYFKGSNSDGVYLKGATVISFYRVTSTFAWVKDVVTANTVAIDTKLDSSIFDSIMHSYDTVLYGLSNRVTSAETSLSGKQDTLSAGIGIDITNNVISVTGGGGGGGKDIIAGRGITVTTGATADTVSFNLPISAGTGNDSIAEGAGTTASGALSHAEGIDTVASGSGSHAEGVETNANGDYSHTEGLCTVTNNMAEHAEGWYNVSNTGSSESAQTLFSVGNGEYEARHNAFEIRKNGDIYITSGNTDIKLQDNLGGNNVVELTQAQYDALITGGTVDPTTFYIITDASAGDLSNYYTKSEVNTALSGKQDTLSAGTGIDITNNVISVTGGGGGGGKAIEGGHGITVTTGATADTVSINLPISAGTGSNSLIVGDNGNTATKSYAIALGSFNVASGASSIAVNDYNVAGGQWSFAAGEGTKAYGSASAAFGYTTKASGDRSFAIGEQVETKNKYEFGCGHFNVSNSTNVSYPNSGNTLFSVGNGTSGYEKHNAFEIRQNGDIYFNDGTNDVKLQDKFTEINNTIGDIETLLAAI